eukprot:1697476-Rhodomonas_salina.3
MRRLFTHREGGRGRAKREVEMPTLSPSRSKERGGEREGGLLEEIIHTERGRKRKSEESRCLHKRGRKKESRLELRCQLRPARKREREEEVENEVALRAGERKSWKVQLHCKDTKILAVLFEEKKCKRIVVTVVVGPHVVVCVLFSCDCGAARDQLDQEKFCRPKLMKDSVEPEEGTWLRTLCSPRKGRGGWRGQLTEPKKCLARGNLPGKLPKNHKLG